ncbi:MAG: Fur family transcriptional regulator [Solirubrobacteraceae bacterium]
MTAAPQVPELGFETIDDAIEALRARGLRLSLPRLAVLEALFDAAGPVSAERIARSLKLVPTSVYRNLETLERHGVLRHVHLGHGPGLYTLVRDGAREFLYCPDCDVARTVRPEMLDPLRAHIRRRFGYEVSFTHFALVGRCDQCASATAANDASSPAMSEPIGA